MLYSFCFVSTFCHPGYSLAGVSRSVTIAAAYLMTVTSFGWRDAVNAIRGVRNQANPNFGFQRQLQKYEAEYVQQVDCFSFLDSSLFFCFFVLDLIIFH